ncbi:MAG: O-succinylbenzoic acid--CoA ligase, partial [Flavobacteriaceae bacterium]|nr:O-succinylbenzoic acid--CoA ligase [Flavobacteriaceae bacterium]
MNISKIHKDFRLNGKSFASVKELLIYAKTVSGGIHSFLSDWFDPDTLIKVRTSGSTGAPKVIALKKQYMLNSARATGNFFGLQAGT